MLEVIKEWQKFLFHWKFFTNIKPQKGKKSNETTFSKEKLDHHDYFYISPMEVK